MSENTESNTSRSVVKTYIPAYQREEWDNHAEELDMSRSEFVRTMVQAGRRGFKGKPRSPSPDEDDRDAQESESAVPDDLESTVVKTLSDEEYLAWEDLLAAVTDDLERQLEETLQNLQDDGRVRYSGRHGGYTLDG